MATRVRTIDFLPEIFKTKTNAQFLAATLDQLAQQPDTRKIQGYIGSKFGYGINSTDKYLVEPTKTRTNYQLEPTVVFKKKDTDIAVDLLTYPGILDSLTLQSGTTNNNSTLFKNQFYSWDSFVDLDKVINHGQYYWLPNGPDAVTVTNSAAYNNLIFDVTSLPFGYSFYSDDIQLEYLNPVLTLIRGGTYEFVINQDSGFFIQTAPGISGVSEARPNISTRAVLGVENNGAQTGTVSFTVPFANAQDGYLFPATVPIDVVTTLSFSDIHGKLASQVPSIDNVFDLKNKTLLFYGVNPGTTADINEFYDVDFGDLGYENTIRSEINKHYYKINFIPTSDGDAVIRLSQEGTLPDNTNLTIKYGTQYIGRSFVKNSFSEISLIPVLTASLDTLYYQNGATPGKVGIIKLIDSPFLSALDVNDILGRSTYTSPTNIPFTNGLKVQFSGNVFPETYRKGQYFVEGVGSSIELLPVSIFDVPEPFGEAVPSAFDNESFDTFAFSETLFAPVNLDYITIARNSLNRNGWARSNRWFHIDVLNISIANNIASPISTAALSNPDLRAKRPILEFYPNLKLFQSGSTSKGNTNFINFGVTDAFNQVAGTTSFSPDGAGGEVYDGSTIIFAGDADVEVRNKIFVVRFSSITPNSAPVITLSPTTDGLVSYNDQTVITQGSTYQGKSFYFDGTYWNAAQVKERVNQPPKFDIFDSNGISFGETDFYPSTTFDGCTLMQYAVGTGTDDTVLGFPISYSSLSNLGDIQFEVTLNTQRFDYLLDSKSATKIVNEGYVYTYRSQIEFERKIGWQTAVEESFQYQVFDTTYTGTPTTPSFVFDVAVKDPSSSLWPTIIVYVNNSRLSNTEFTYTVSSTETVIVLAETPALNTSINVMLYSDQVSKTGYYQTPSNLDHNPFNGEITTINLGDIRGHYKSICNNAPEFVGMAFGPNNYRDLGNVVPYGTKIIQNSSSVVNCAAFLRNNDNNFFDALAFNANEYVKFKITLVDTLEKNDYNSAQTADFILDDVLDKLASVKVDENPFFWSDMLPSKNALITNRYVFNPSLSTGVFPLSRVYDFSSANYYGVLVYLTRRVGNQLQTMQLIKGVDYEVSSTEKNLIIAKQLLPKDLVIVKEYDQTYGSYIPNTPTKLGLYPSFIPCVVLDNTYLTPAYFIKGHDGSYSKLYGTYTDGILDDYRDNVLFEFEKRIYNNLKVTATLPVAYDEIVPGQFRDVGYSVEDFTKMYSSQFLNWTGQNRINYKAQTFNSSDPFTYNYTSSSYKLNKKPVTQGSWRGIYLWLFDTTNPDTSPWEMLGLVDKPTWWDSRYGIAPYTSDNTLMWTEISTGYVWNNGAPFVNSNRKRPDLLSILPVDSAGRLISPFESVIGSYDTEKFKHEWKVGEYGPAEFSYLHSSSWPFDLMKLMALMKPAKFFSLGIDLDHYKYNTEFDQYLYNNRFRNFTDRIEVYGNGNSVSSYINWMVDYLYQFGINGSTTINDLVKNLDVRLTYRLAGFSDKDLLNFYVEKGTPNSSSNSLLIPDDSYSVLLYDNQPTDTIVYSSVIIQKSEYGFKIYGNSQNKTYFMSNVPSMNGIYDTFTVNGKSLKVPRNYYMTPVLYPYGHEFISIDEVAAFMRGYGLFLTAQGVVFDDIENGLELSWDQMISEVFYWQQTGWDVGSIINVNPVARTLTINKESQIVQPLTIKKENFALNQNLVPIALGDLHISRNETEFKIKTLNQGDTIALFKASLSTIEHVVVFDNNTVFNDVIYNLITGLRQQRIFVKGTKTAEWNGTMNAAGFILNQDNIKDWEENAKYNKGTIVKFKNEYYIANLPVILPSATFNYTVWDKTSYDLIQKGLLPNPSTKAYEATLYYDSTNPNLQNDADLLSFSLIGYRPRDYFAQADLDDATQVNLYKNMISIKGTVDSVTRLQGINLKQNTLNYDIHENWAIKNSEFGGVLNQNFVEFTLNEGSLTGNPSIVGIIKNEGIDGIQQEIPLYRVKNYGKPVGNVNILPVTSQQVDDVLPNAGYVNLDDVSAIGYTVSSLPDATISDIYKNDYLYVAEKDSTWQAYTPVSTTALVTAVVNNLNDTVTIVFDKPHNLYTDQVVGIVGFDSRVDGYHNISFVVDLQTIIVPLTLDVAVSSIIGNGLSYLLQSQRVLTARDITNLPFLNAEYTQNKVWVDKNVNGDWTVYEKLNNYKYNNLQPIALTTQKLGSAVCYVAGIGYFISDPTTGSVYHFDKNAQGFYLRSTITNPGAFGTAIVSTDELLIISSPSDTMSQIYIYRIPTSTNINSIVLQQVITFGGRIGDSLSISGDNNLLYIGAPIYNTVVPFQRDRVQSFASSGTQLNIATVPTQKYFYCNGDVVSFLPEGVRATFLTSFTDLNMTIAVTVTELVNYFTVSGDQRTKVSYGTQVSFNNTGPISTRIYTVGSKSYDPVADRTTFYTIEYFEVGTNIVSGTKVYQIQFNETSVYTVVTGIYEPTENRTKFYTVEPIEYSAPAGSYIYLASDNFSVAGFLTSPLAVTGDNFGFSLATNYDGSKLFAGAPNTNYSSGNTQIADTGVVYVWDRLVQNVEVQYDQGRYQLYVIILPFNPTNQTRVYVNDKLLAGNKYVVILNGIAFGNIELRAGDIITVSSLNFVNTSQVYSQDNLTDLRPGELFGYALDCNRFGNELVVGCPFDVTNDSMKEGSAIRFTNPGKRFGRMNGVIAANLIEPTYLLLNGQTVNAFNTIPLLSTVTTGSTTFTVQPALAAKLPAYGVVTFRNAVTGVERAIGYSGVNAATGVVTFSVVFPYSDTFSSGDGYVIVPLGSAANIANAINQTNIDNIRAYATEDGRLQIFLLKIELGQINNKLNISVFNGNYLYQMGFIDYVKSQVIQDPHAQTQTQFGYAVKFNEENSFVVSAPTSIRYTNTTFDFSDDNNIHNDTAFDNNLTTFEEKLGSAGSVYMYDYIPCYEESFTNISNYVYAQSCNDLMQDVGMQPMYGSSLAFSNGTVIVGAPNFKPTTVGGRAVVYENTTGQTNWHVYRESAQIVDINKIQKIQLYDNVSNENLAALDYIDPLQGKLLGIVRENLDFISNTDPAGYNGPDANTGSIAWTNNQVGKLWFNTSTARFLNYHQDDVEYNSKYWGTVFPGSVVTVYSWVESLTEPAFYAGPGVPYDISKYSAILETNNNDGLIAKYFFWVRNTNTVFAATGKALSDTVIEQYITDPKNSGVPFFSPLRSNVFALYNAQDYINDVSTNLHIGYSQSTTDTSGHQEFQLIRSDYPDDFLSGFPNSSKGYNTPVGLYDRLLDSLSGTDETGAIVPDPYLPKLLQTGVSVRPRQSFFIDRFEALRNYLEYANNVVSQYPINESGNTTFLLAQGENYNTSSYWENIYWWAAGYSNATRAAMEVLIYSDLLTLSPTEGLIVGVASNAQGNREVYAYTAGAWTRIGVANGTVKFLSTLWDYEANKIGFGEAYYDSTGFDQYPSVETRNIIRALNEQIYVNSLFEHRNKSLILLFEYIQSESTGSQNYLPWLTKTSFTDVNYTVRELTMNQRFQRDNQSLLQGYINEIKPYHVVLKDFYLKYTRTDVFEGAITDFDLPAKYNEQLGRFVSPQISYTSGDEGPYTWDTDNAIWQNVNYSDWYTNFGTSLSGAAATEVCTLAKFLGTIDQEILVDNAQGMPVIGIIQLGSELIGYTSINRETKTLTGLSRGIDGTQASAHFAGTSLIMNLPGVIVLNTGRGYEERPEVTAYVNTAIHPAPKKAAILRAVMSLDKVVGVNVIDPGEGYVVEPEIIFQSSFDVVSAYERINFINNTIQINSTAFEIGDLVYSAGITTTGKTIIADGYYYLGITSILAASFAISTDNASIVSFYRTKSDSLTGNNRVSFVSAELIDLTYSHKLSMVPRAVPSMVNTKTRGLSPTLRFDRTSYQAKISAWSPNQYYSSPYISLGNDTSSPAKMYVSVPYTEIFGTVFPSGGTNAKFTVFNVLLGQEYYVTITNAGVNYNLGDVITVSGTALNGSAPDNNCEITVTSVGADGEVESVTVSGIAVDASLASLQGAVLPVVGLTSVDGNAVVEVDYSYSGLNPAQVKKSNMYFYRVLTPYVYDNSSAPTKNAVIRVSRPRFNPFDISNLYAIQIIDAGTGYEDGDIIVIPGSLLGGVDIINDATITVQFADLDSSIFSARVAGISAGQYDRFFVTPISDTELAVYSDPTLVIPVPYNSFMWDNSTGTDYGYLPEPVTNNMAYNYSASSIVTYAGYIWQCVQSNNDTEFNPARWYLLNSADPALNALDRIEAYYQPTINMPGKDAQQLMKGITYPNNVYYGNSFSPEDELPLDFVVRDQPFYPSDINVKAVVFDGVNVIAACDTSINSVVLISNPSGTWNSYILSNKPLGITDITFSEGMYIITTTNIATPVYLSYDAVNWVTNGVSASYDRIEFGEGGFDFGGVNIANNPLQGVIADNGQYFVVGQYISRSTNGIDWDQVFTFGSRLENKITDISYVNTTFFTGYIAVGRGFEVTAGAGTSAPTIQSVARIVTSITGLQYSWEVLLPSLSFDGFNGVTASTSLVVVVGDNGAVWYSTNASNWVKGNISGAPVVTNIKSVTFGNGTFVAVGEKAIQSPGAGWETSPGLIMTSIDGMTWTQRSSQYVTTENLNDVYFSSGVFYASGENDTILKSTNGIDWNSVSNIQVDDPYYVVKGNDFLYGYGPEELVAGVVSDTLSMYVNTAPGAYWDLDTETSFWYKYTGFNMKTVTALPDLALTVSFANVVVNPARIAVSIKDTTTGLSYGIHELTSTNNPISYSVDWFSQSVTLNQSLAANKSVMIEVYEVGNGKELVRGNSQLYPLQLDADTGTSVFVFNILYQSIVNEPIIYANGIKLVYLTDYYVTFTNNLFMKIVFNTVYDSNADYIVYSVLGESLTSINNIQYGYSIPEKQSYIPTGVVSSIPLDASLTTLTGDNILNAIVEVNGIRLVPYPLAGYDYQFNETTNTVELVSAVSANDIVSVTTFYDTSRQYLVTNSYINKRVTKISYVDNTKSILTISFLTDPVFVSGNQIIINGLIGSEELNDNTYYVKVVSGTYTLYSDSALTLPVVGSSISTYGSGGFASLVTNLLSVPYPTVPNLKDQLTYTDGTRTWVTINGQRLDPSKVVFYEDNKLSIKYAILSTDEIVVTAVIDGASPNQTSYNVNVNKYNDGVVYRTNLEDGSWLTQPFNRTEDTMHFYNVSRLTDKIATTVNVELIGAAIVAFVQCDINQVKELQVYNETTLEQLADTDFGISLVNGKPAVIFTSKASVGDVVQVVLDIGNIVEINGERIRFSNINIAANTISGLTRGVQGTRVKEVHEEFSLGYGINAARRLTDEQYAVTWNSANITTKGDPLQISTTQVAEFLQNNQS